MLALATLLARETATGHWSGALKPGWVVGEAAVWGGDQTRRQS